MDEILLSFAFISGGGWGEHFYYYGSEIVTIKVYGQ